MFKLWIREAQDARLIAVLLGMIALLFALLVGGLGVMYQWPSKIKVHHVPGLSEVLVTSIDDVPMATLYGFGFAVWGALNTWQDGEEGYNANLMSYRFYLTPRYYKEREVLFQKLVDEGELQNRTSTLRPTTDRAFSTNDIRVSKAGDSWHLSLKLRLTETTEGETIKDVIMEYTLRIVPYAIPEHLNMFGLALDGLASEPVRLETLL